MGLSLDIQFDFTSDRSGNIGAFAERTLHQYVRGADPIEQTIRNRMNKRDIEEALRRSETQLQETFDAMGDAIHVTDEDRNIVLINKAFTRWMKELGLEEKPVGKLFRDVFPFLSAKVDKEYQKVLQAGKTLITEKKTRIGEREIFTETRKCFIFPILWMKKRRISAPSPWERVCQRDSIFTRQNRSGCSS